MNEAILNLNNKRKSKMPSSSRVDGEAFSKDKPTIVLIYQWWNTCHVQDPKKAKETKIQSESAPKGNILLKVYKRTL